MARASFAPIELSLVKFLMVNIYGQNQDKTGYA